MDIHNLSVSEKERERSRHMCMDFPYAFSISLGEWLCNRKCRMCPMFSMPPKKERYMQPDVFERACSELGEEKVNLELSAYGEPFMHPDINKYLNQARKLCPNAHIVVATNGTLLDSEQCEKIVDSGINHLSFSLDAGSAESYEWLTGKSDYSRIESNLERLVEIRNKRGADHLWITTHIIGIQELAHEFDSFVKKWSPVVDRAVVRTYGNWAGLVDNHGVTPAEKQCIPDERYPCAWLWYASKIEPNGDVSKCFVHITGEYDSIGNIMEKPFREIWHGVKMRELRAKHLLNEPEKLMFCKECIVWSLFPKFWDKVTRDGHTNFSWE